MARAYSTGTASAAPGSTGEARVPTTDPLQPYGNAAAIEALGASGRDGRAPVVATASPQVASLLQQAAAVEPLAAITRFDKDGSNVSGYDWYGGLGMLRELPPTLLGLAPSQAVFQDAIWFLYEAVTREPDPSRQRVYDLGSGALRSEPIPDGVDPGYVDTACKVAPDRLTENSQIIDNVRTRPGTFPWDDQVAFDPVGRTERKDFGHTVADAMAARERLREDFHFDPDERSLQAVRQLRGHLAPDQLQPFLDAYLTAFFVNGAPPGGGLKYDYPHFEDTERAVDTFFGDPPGCDQLPDGRCIVDCKGFTAVSRLLLRELSCEPLNQRGGTELAFPFAVHNHQMVLLRSGDRVMAVDNDDVEILPMTASELAELDRLHESCFQDGWTGTTEVPLQGPVDLPALPTLRAYTEDVVRKYRMPEGARVTWYDSLPVLAPDHA